MKLNRYDPKFPVYDYEESNGGSIYYHCKHGHTHNVECARCLISWLFSHYTFSAIFITEILILLLIKIICLITQ